jgi:acetate kinase
VKVLVLNSGSSSIKYELRDVATGGAPGKSAGASTIVTAADVDRIGEEDGVPDHGRALELILAALVAPRGPLSSLAEVEAVGHRVVHGGSYFTGPALLTPDVVGKIEECAPLAPLHNPPALLGIREALRVLPGVPQVAVFDTAFHATIPASAHVYALPYDYYLRHGVRRYGFHGISFKSVTRTADVMLDGKLAQLNAVVAHLGNGASITAVAGGRSVDTSMGLTPLEGLVMGTRPGDVDPGVLLYLMRELGLSPADLDQVLNKQSGLLGVSGVSNDMRDVLAAAAQGDERAGLALEIYCYRLRKYIGAYAAALGGLDLLVFTAGVGENSPDIRAKVCQGLAFLGIELDAEANANTRGVSAGISAQGSRVTVLVIATDEEGVIAEETVAVVIATKRSNGGS